MANKQIKKYRMNENLSQEELADKIYVTRQTISNWETGKNYPDLNSIVLLNTLFHISLNHFIKGDIEEMKEQIQKEDIQRLRHNSSVYFIDYIYFIDWTFIYVKGMYWCVYLGSYLFSSVVLCFKD